MEKSIWSLRVQDWCALIIWLIYFIAEPNRYFSILTSNNLFPTLIYSYYDFKIMHAYNVICLFHQQTKQDLPNISWDSIYKMVASIKLLDMRFRFHILLVWVFYSYFYIIQMNWKSVELVYNYFMLPSIWFVFSSKRNITKTDQYETLKSHETRELSNNCLFRHRKRHYLHAMYIIIYQNSM